MDAIPTPMNNPISCYLSRGLLVAAFTLVVCAPVRAGTLYLARLTQANENPPSGATFTGTGVLILNDAENTATITATHNITLPVTGGHIHRGSPTVNGPVIFPFPAPTSPVGPLTWSIPAAEPCPRLSPRCCGACATARCAAPTSRARAGCATAGGTGSPRSGRSSTSSTPAS